MRYNGKAPTEVWQEVPPRKRGGQNRDSNQKKTEAVTKFFVSNIPDKCSVEDLKRFLGDYGKIDKVYVARKFDKFGQRFAFVNFLNVRNIQELEGKMKNVKMGDKKLFISLAKFVDGNFVGHRRQPEKPKDMPEKSVDKSGTEDVYRSNETHFRDKLLNKEIPKNQEIIDVAPNVCAFTTWFDLAVIGKVKEFSQLISLRINLDDAGFKKVEIKYVGGFFVLLKFANKEEAGKFEMEKEIWEAWFHKVEVWKGQMLPYERVAWVKIYGVPLNLALTPVFNVIGSKFGKVVQSANLSEEDADLSFTCLGILYKDGKRINEKVVLRWQNKILQVWVEEEQRDWVPDCLIEEQEEEIEDNMEPEEPYDQNMDVNGVEGSDLAPEDDRTVQDSPVESNLETQDKLEGSNEIEENPGRNNNLDNFFAFSFFNKERVGVAKKFKRLKTRQRKQSKSPQAHSHMKKRPRKNDPFDLNGLLGLRDEDTCSDQSPTCNTNPKEFLTPDLNVARESISNEGDGGFLTGGVNNFEEGEFSKGVIGDDGSTSAKLDPQKDLLDGSSNLLSSEDQHAIENESNATVLLGKDLGAANLEYFHDQVRNLVAKEGCQLVHQ